MALRPRWGASDICRLHILIDGNKDVLTVTVATVAYHVWCPRPPLSFNSGLMSGPGIGVRDDRDRRSEQASRVEQRITGSEDHYCRRKSSQFHNSVQPQSILVTVAVTRTPSHRQFHYLPLCSQYKDFNRCRSLNCWNMDLARAPACVGEGQRSRAAWNNIIEGTTVQAERRRAN